MTQMQTVEIAGETYEKRACFSCGGTGTARDATNADKVCTGGSAETKCSHCRGEGHTLHSMKIAALAAAATPKRESVEIGEMPDWMLG